MAKKLGFLVAVLLFFNIQGCNNTGRIPSTESELLSDMQIDEFIDGLQEVRSDGTTYLISAYDDIMIEVGESEGQDWRMMAAIAYCESRFRNDVESHRGARGIMQIMPVVAKQFDVPVKDIIDPQTNVLLAAKLLNLLDKMLGLGKDMPYAERMKFILASYNCGVGHIKDARNLARKYGANPDAWNDVSHYLKLKSNPDIASDEVVRHGCIKSGNGVVSFVDKVMGRYRTYCSQYP